MLRSVEVTCDSTIYLRGSDLPPTRLIGPRDARERKTRRRCKDPVRGRCLCSLTSGPGSGSGTTLAAGRILAGPASQYILHWSASIGLPARSPLIRPATRRFNVRPDSDPSPGPNRCANFSRWQLSRPDDTQCPFFRRRRDFARGDFQEENRVLTVHDVPPALSRTGGIPAEGSPEGRKRPGTEYHPACCAHGLKRSHRTSCYGYRTNIN